MRLIFALLVLLFAGACAPKESVVLQEIKLKELSPSSDGRLHLTADAIFYNPNASGMKLKGIDISIELDGKKVATVDHDLDIRIKARSQFTVPVDVAFEQNVGLVDTLLGLLGKKSHELIFDGKLRIRVKGFPVRVPVRHREEVRF